VTRARDRFFDADLEDALPGERRFYSEDPWGNRIEFLAEV